LGNYKKKGEVKFMKLLILTQKIDSGDDVLGFFHNWVAEFAKHCESLTVVCLQKGEYNLPDNVKVLSLGKEQNNFQFPISNFQTISNFQFFKKLAYVLRFYKYIWQERKNYDSVFVHMNQIYVVLGGVFWRIWKKKIGLWYTHKQVSLSLRMAERLVDIIFTASKESFSLKSRKLKVMGHGVFSEKFIKVKVKSQELESGKFRVLTVGRISPLKDLKTLIKAVGELKIKNYELKIVGRAGTDEQEKYFQEVKDLAKKLKTEDNVRFIGSVPNREVVKYYSQADLFINMAPTGGLDKAILEAMSCEVPVLVCNKTLEDDLSRINSNFIFEYKNYKELSEKIKFILDMRAEERIEIGKKLRKIVIEKHDLKNLIKRIVEKMKEA
jgi:glycosyltransferase involved in cell wall biosynthesis